MDFIPVVIVIVMVVLSVKGLIALFARLDDQPTNSHQSASHQPTIFRRPKISNQELCEKTVTAALRSLDMKSYIVFENLILPSTGNTSLTEIDQVVVSPHGIFCIETKSHHGSIYGYTTSGKWKQYLGGKEFDIINPLHQNYKHIRAIEDLLGADLKAKVHSYVVYPNARSVKIDGEHADYSIDEVKRKISRHIAPVYNLQDCEKILKTLAVASSKREELKHLHTAEVRAYLKGKVAAASSPR
jgi:hypothetical protein